MRIALRHCGHIGNQVNHFGGGETRWTANLGFFLSQSGHEVVRCVEGEDQNCAIFLDAGWEECHRIKSPVHVHFSYFAQNNGLLNYECFKSGKAVMAVPYRDAWVQNQVWAKNQPYKFTNICIPQPYPDQLLPAHSVVPGFQRNEIFWGTKDCFHPTFEPQRRGEREHVFVQGGLDTLRALLRLQQKADFKMNFLLTNHTLSAAHPRFGVPQLLSQFKNKDFYDVVPWTGVVDILARCKLNTPVGGLWGSIPETIFTKGLPMLFPRNQFSERFGTILPFPEHADEQDIYWALETLWFDERVYARNYEILQELFKDHRNDGLKQCLDIAFETLGVK